MHSCELPCSYDGFFQVLPPSSVFELGRGFAAYLFNDGRIARYLWVLSMLSNQPFGRLIILVLFTLPLLTMRRPQFAKPNVMTMSELNTRVRCINEGCPAHSWHTGLFCSCRRGS